MFNPSDGTIGRGLLVFGALMLGLGVFLLIQHVWRDAVFWLALALFSGCFGTIALDYLPRLRRLWLVLGLAAGIAALVVGVISAT